MENITQIKLELLCKGIRLPEHIMRRLSGYRFKRASLSEGICFDLFPQGVSQTIPINLAVHEKFVHQSPFVYDEDRGMILKNGNDFVRALMIEAPTWYSNTLDDGTVFQEVFQVHYHTILATSLTNFCEFREVGKGCHFCALGSHTEKPKVKSVEQIVSVLDKLIKQSVPFSEINLNAGSFLDEKHCFQLYLHVIEGIRKITDVPIYVQICPPTDISLIDRLVDVGVSSLSFNLEVYDEEIRKEIMPAKARISCDYYFRAMAHAKKLLGTVQVSSWIIAGLEPPESTINGIKRIVSEGMIPFVTVFRPLVGSKFEKRMPPEPDTLIPVFEVLKESLSNLKFDRQKTKCGCVRCNCCSAAEVVL